VKYINYAILLAVMFGVCIWVFNHMSAWAGVLFAFAIVYFLVWKSLNLIKVKSNEKT
jgi:hypothetical protein